MNCPHCQKALPENYTASFCPHCGGAVQQPNPATPAAPPLALIKINWWIFFGVLLAPPLLTFLTAFLGKEHPNEQVSPLIGLLGGATAGIFCGIMLALRIGKSISIRVGLGILFSCILATVCILMSFGGCMLGQYQLQFGK